MIGYGYCLQERRKGEERGPRQRTPRMVIGNGLRTSLTMDWMVVSILHLGTCKSKFSLDSYADCCMRAFSLNTFGFNSASCEDILRSSALSNFAPNASLLKSALFSALGTNRCSCKFFCSKRSKLAFHALISAARGSLEPIVLTVSTVGVREGA